MKTKYRQSILEARNALSSSEVVNLSSQIIKIADEKLALTDVKTLGSYFASNNEVDMKNLNNNRRELNRITTYPVIGPNQSMKFIEPKNSERLNKNKFNIFEPSDGNEIAPMMHKVIIVPTVGIDSNGYRLGHGGGYYDRLLMPILQNKNRPLIIGLIYDFQFINEAINEAHDIKLDIVFSEKKIEEFS
ncbi:MAG: 5-formyltetrahydrofolate cyclo-ligase [Gammaproteobacteria bacterium]|nr:5-formyltetrahydrofolate cyclo-ligase [Gammaproteobacteria bacterium]